MLQFAKSIVRPDQIPAQPYTQPVTTTRPRSPASGWRTRLGLGDDADWQAAVVLASSLVLLVVHWHYGRPGAFTGSGLQRSLVDWLGDGDAADYAGTLPYLYWGLASLVLRIGLPLAIVVWVLRRRPGDFGYRVEGIGKHLPAYGALYLAMLPLILVASALDAFQATYPFYDRAVEGGLQFWLYQGGYALQFVALEAFFRGYMVFGLRDRLGAPLAVLVMTVPYVMVHFGKPALEVFAAIGAGLILGALALRSRSWVPGVFLHVAVALTMDVSAIARRTGSLGSALARLF